MFRTIKLIILSALFLILDFAFVRYIKISAVAPMLSYCFIIVYTQFTDKCKQCLIPALIVGLLFDVLFGVNHGCLAAMFAVSAFASYLVKDSLFSSKLLMALISVTVFTFVLELLYYVVFISGANNGFFACLVRTVIPMTLYNGVATAVLYPLVRRLFEGRRQE